MIVRRESERATHEIEERIEGVLRMQSAKGMLASGNTVISVVDALDKIAESFMRALASRLQAVGMGELASPALQDAASVVLAKAEARFVRALSSMGLKETNHAVAAWERFEIVRRTCCDEAAILALELSCQTSELQPLAPKPIENNKSGGQSFADFDAPFIEEMRELFISKKAKSVYVAASIVAPRAKSLGTLDSVVDRLRKAYGRKYPTRPRL